MDSEKYLTSTGGIETSLLAEEGLVVDCKDMDESQPPLYSVCPSTISLCYVLSRSFLFKAKHLLFPFGGVTHTLSAEEFARDVDGFASDDDNLLAVKELLGDGAGKATEEVALAVNDNLQISRNLELAMLTLLSPGPSALLSQVS